MGSETISGVSPPDGLDVGGDVVLAARGVAKRFCRNLRRSMWYGIGDLARSFAGRPQSVTGLRRDEFWALNDVSFVLRRGETLGIVGCNGSGKSTLLRVLCGIFPPDRGEVAFVGRIGGLIALGAGMHPHLTGIENIYLNGAVLGMSRSEIRRQLDDIVAFAELKEFMGAPLSTYSSGMKVRLGFAVAIHCRPDILLLDEVIAVGDLSFQRKCFERIEALRAARTATIFISHNLRQVQRLCDRVIWLQEGRVRAEGDPGATIQAYQNEVVHEKTTPASGSTSALSGETTGEVRVVDVALCAADGVAHVVHGRPMSFAVHLEVGSRIPGAIVGLGITTSDAIVVTSLKYQCDLDVGQRILRWDAAACLLLPGRYGLAVTIKGGNGRTIFRQERPVQVDVLASTRSHLCDGLFDMPMQFHCRGADQPAVEETGRP
jgi:lipopolysaccharide transport system ATP-binding protein